MGNATSAGLTPGKLATIVVLSIVLLVVIVVQYGGSGKVKRRAKRKPRAVESKQPTDVASRQEQPLRQQPQFTPWPAYELDELLQHNPFSLPEALQPQEQQVNPAVVEASEDVPVESGNPGIRGLRRRQADLMTSLKEQGVDMVLVTPQGRVARIGAATFRVGDLVEGLVVQEISEAGIVFVQESTLGQ